MSLERLWAGWRAEFVTGAASGQPDGCLFCAILESKDPAYVLRRAARCAAILNAYPYTSGHLMVLPTRHVADLEALTADESREVWNMLADAVRALKAAYRPDGLNVGVNLGRSAGAGVPGHFHVHCLPRWDGDTNFMTATAETRVLPESLGASYDRLEAAWPTGSQNG